MKLLLRRWGVGDLALELDLAPNLELARFFSSSGIAHRLVHNFEPPRDRFEGHDMEAGQHESGMKILVRSRALFYLFLVANFINDALCSSPDVPLAYTFPLNL
jgi:hypothetical protein